MKRSGTIIVILSTMLIVVGIATASFLTDYSSTISTVVTTCTAVVGAIALYFQLKKDKEINQASFVIEFYKTFKDDDAIQRIYDILNAKGNGDKKATLKNNYNDLLNYLNWIRSLCMFIKNGTLSFKVTHEIFGYKFFAVLNDEEVQEMEIVTYSKYYSLFYEIHKQWSQYCRKNGFVIPFEETSLEKTEPYKKMFKVK